MALKEASDPRESMNGEILQALPPPRPRIIAPDEQLPKGAGFPELARAYATAVATVHPHLPAIYGELDEMRAGVNFLGQKLHAHGEKIDAIHTLLSGMVTAAGSPTILPPMRDRRETNNDLIEHLTARAESELRKRASETPGPGVGDPPEVVAGKLREMMEEFIAEREARDKARAESAELLRLRAEKEAREEDARRTAAKAKADAERQAIEAVREAKRRKRETRTEIVKWVARVTAPLTVAFLGWLAATTYAKAQRAEGAAEERARSSVPVLTVVAPNPSISAAPATSIAPGHR
jgi:hypothetical protein